MYITTSMTTKKLTECDVSFSENSTRSNFFIFQLNVSILFSILFICISTRPV